MTWNEAKLAIQLEAEERAGFVMRERIRMRQQAEDAAFAADASVGRVVGSE